MGNKMAAWRSVSGLCLLLAAGCGSGVAEPEIAIVTGTVTVDGQPEAGLLVSFEPQVKGGSGKSPDVGGVSTGETDADGNYELSYKGSAKKGAVLGKHKVRIERMSAEGGAALAGGEAAAPPREALPPRYGLETTLTAEVEQGENVKDFELTTN